MKSSVFIFSVVNLLEKGLGVVDMVVGFGKGFGAVEFPNGCYETVSKCFVWVVSRVLQKRGLVA